MAGISFDPKISLGHLITTGTVLVGVGIGWANLDNRVKATEVVTVSHTIAIKELSDESEVDRLTLNGIRIDVGYLRDWVEDIKQQDRASVR